MAPLTVVEQLRLDPMFGFNICDSKTDSKELKDIEHILEKAHGIVRSQRCAAGTTALLPVCEASHCRYCFAFPCVGTNFVILSFEKNP